MFAGWVLQGGLIKSGSLHSLSTLLLHKDPWNGIGSLYEVSDTVLHGELRHSQ